MGVSSFTIQDAPPSHFRWLVERTSAGLTSGARGIEAVNEQGQIVGMVIFDGWTENAAFLHIAIDQPRAVFRLVREAFGYLYGECGKDIALGVVPESNQHALEFDKRMGFREVHRVTDGWKKGEALVLIELRKADCRYFKEQR